MYFKVYKKWKVINVIFSEVPEKENINTYLNKLAKELRYRKVWKYK